MSLTGGRSPPLQYSNHYGGDRHQQFISYFLLSLIVLRYEHFNIVFVGLQIEGGDLQNWSFLWMKLHIWQIDLLYGRRRILHVVSKRHIFVRFVHSLIRPFDNWRRMSYLGISIDFLGHKMSSPSNVWMIELSMIVINLKCFFFVFFFR